MIIHKVHKANPVTGEVDDVEIHIKGILPEDLSCKDTFALYESDAELIADVLFCHLPLGTRHALLVKMMTRSPAYYKGKIT